MIDREVIRARLLERINRDPETKCWVYCGSWNAKGQARMRVGFKVYTIQTVSAWVFKRIELWRKCVRYRICTTPACCNPAHIRVAETIVEALADMRRRGLFHNEGFHWLRPGQKRCIRYLVENGRTVAAIAAHLKMNVATIRRACA